MNRPTLIPGLPRIWRRPGELQIGSDPARALLLHLPDPRCERVLDLLDGTRSERLVTIRAAEFGVTEAECRALLDALCAAGAATVQAYAADVQILWSSTPGRAGFLRCG